MSFFIKSAGIVNGIIKSKYGKRSKELINGIPQRSFPLAWENPPAGTKVFAITFIDYDNCEEEGFPWIHWSIANIPKECSFLEENVSLHLKEIDPHMIQGKNTWIMELPRENQECNRYGGPAPVKTSHEYEIRIYALSRPVKLEDGYYYNQLLKEIEGNVLGEAVLYGRYII